MTTPKNSRKTANGNRATKDSRAARPVRKSRRNATRREAELAIRPGSKQASLVALLERPEGATIEQMCAKTSWQAHSVRAAMTGLRKRGIGVTRDKNDVGTTVYHIVPQSQGSPA